MKVFWKASLIRSLRTVCQTAIAVIGSSFVLEDVNWWTVLSASVLAGVLSILTSVATGLPEVEWKHQQYMDIEPPEDAEVMEDDD